MSAVLVDLFGQPLTEPEGEQIQNGQSEQTLQGRYAEFMVCAYITKIGYNVLHVDASGFDLILEYEGRSYRIDVKSTNKIYRGPFKESAEWHAHKAYWSDGRVKKDRRKTTRDDADLLALFHASFETVVFYPVTKPINRVRLPLSFVRNSGHGEASLIAAIEKLNGGGGI